MFQTNIVYNVSKPTLTVFTPDPSVANGTQLLFVPAAAFMFYLSIVKVLMLQHGLTKKGVTCFVLKYRLSP